MSALDHHACSAVPRIGCQAWPEKRPEHDGKHADHHEDGEREFVFYREGTADSTLSPDEVDFGLVGWM